MTKFARVLAGTVIEPPLDWAEFTPDKAFPAELAAEYVECPEDIGQGWSFDGEQWAAPVAPAGPPTKAELMAYAADKRWRVETGGIVVDGAVIRTDDKSQSRVSGAALLAFSDPDLVTIDWEAQPGIWIEVPAATMKAIGIAVGRHVQACFSILKVVQVGIAAGTITTTADIDAAAWPANGS